MALDLSSDRIMNERMNVPVKSCEVVINCKCNCNLGPVPVAARSKA